MRSTQYPQTLSDFSSSNEVSALLSSYTRTQDDPGEKIDYSDFSNFCFFSSARNLYNIFLYKVFNFYNRTFSWDEYYTFIDSLSGFEKHSFYSFPSYRGYFFNSGTNADRYIEGIDYENKLSLTSSNNALSIEFCCSISASNDPSSNANQYILQRGNSDKYYEVFLSSSNKLIFRLQSGSSILSASCPYSSSYMGVGHHFAFCYASASAATNVYLDGMFIFSTSSDIISTLVLDTGSIYLGCSSSQLQSGPPTNYYLTGSIDEVRIWNSYRTPEQIYEYYDRHIKWEPELVFYTKFNEPHYTMSNGALFNKVYDYAKRPIDCEIKNYVSSSKQQGVLVDATGSNILVDDYYDPLLFDDDQDVVSFIQTVWDKADERDRNNRNLITDLIPQNYIEEEINEQSYNLTNLLYLFARQLDEMKLHIQSAGNLWKHSYDDSNVIPYKLLKDAIELFGFQSFDSFPLASIDELQKSYSINETNILAIKEVNEIFWRNLLANIIYIYKTKGTRESVKSFLNCLGIDENVLSIKDYSSQYSYPVSESFVNHYKYAKCLNFITNTNTGSYVHVSSSQLPYTLSGSFSVETNVAFKPYVAYESGTFNETIIVSKPKVLTGSIWNFDSGCCLPQSEYGLFFTRYDLTSSFGKIHLITSGSSEGTIYRLSTPLLEIFDGDFINVSYRRMPSSSSYTSHYLDIKKLNNTDVETLYTGSVSYVTSSNPFVNLLLIGGASGSRITEDISSIPYSTETKQREFRIWDHFLTSSDLDAHCINFTSIGVKDPENKYYTLVGHWIFDDDISSNSSGEIYPLTNYSIFKNILDASGSSFITSSNSFDTELSEYNFLCPDLSLKWNVNKVRFANPKNIIEDDDRVDIFSVEFNLIDSLNEDIIRLFSDMNKFSRFIGVPSMKNKGAYDLEKYMNELYFSRLDNNISFVNYFNNLSTLNRFYFSIIENLIPARTFFIGDERVIESHLLERNKKIDQIAANVPMMLRLTSVVGRS